MLRSAASKVMWVGRATVFLVGLSVILALVFGAISTVSAHTGDKGFFHLGHRNVSGAVSKLVGKVAGPSLFIGNGSEDPRASALRLNVKAGKAPMKVNAAAGKATNLNADKLDGKDATEIGVNGWEEVEHASAWNSDYYKVVDAHCPEDKIVVGTGFDVQGAWGGTGSNQHTNVVPLGVTIVRYGSSTEYVRVRAIEEEPTLLPWLVRAIAICAKAP